MDRVTDPGGGPHAPASVPIGRDPFEDGSLDVPNCPACLHPMDAAGTPSGGAYWRCAACGQTRVA